MKIKRSNSLSEGIVDSATRFYNHKRTPLEKPVNPGFLRNPSPRNHFLPHVSVGNNTRKRDEFFRKSKVSGNFLEKARISVKGVAQKALSPLCEGRE